MAENPATWDMGVGRGDVVAFLDKNHPACVEISMAAGSLGAANAIVNWRLAGEEVDYAVNDSGAKVLVVGTELVPLLEKIRDRLPAVEKVIEVTPDGAAGDQYEAWLRASDRVTRPDDVDPDDTCLVMYSSGTTGHPKGVMLTHANMLPKNRLGRQILKKLKVYSGPNHPHQAQQATPFEIVQVSQ